MLRLRKLLRVIVWTEDDQICLAEAHGVILVESLLMDLYGSIYIEINE